MSIAALSGFLTGLSLILAIGAQNAFVLRQGLVGRHVFALCLLCSLSDAVLVSVGVAGFGWIVTFSPAFPQIMSVAGAVFLAVYGARRLMAALKGSSHLLASRGVDSLARTLWTGLALTWLNPHVYLDTLGLIGAVSTGFHGVAARGAFALGAITSSFVFFFSLGYGARLLGPIMQTARAWRILDFLIALTMWTLAIGLIRAAAIG